MYEVTTIGDVKGSDFPIPERRSVLLTQDVSYDAPALALVAVLAVGTGALGMWLWSRVKR